MVKKNVMKLVNLVVLILIVLMFSGCLELASAFFDGASSATRTTRTCPTCEGYGWVWVTDWQGWGEERVCPTCGGSGRV